MLYVQNISKTWNENLHTQFEPIRKKSALALESLSNGLHFVQRFIQSPTTVGSVFPSSRALAKKIVCLIPENPSSSEGKHYLEVGPGTGSFTEEIIKKMSAKDHLDVVEIDPTFCEILRKKFANSSNVQIHCQSIEDWHPDYHYDAIISGLPLNVFTPDMVQRFIDTFKKLARAGGTVSYFEYAWLPKIKINTLSGDEKKRFQRVLDIKNEFYKNFGTHSEPVYRNFPPAKVLHFKIGHQLPSPAVCA